MTDRDRRRLFAEVAQGVELITAALTQFDEAETAVKLIKNEASENTALSTEANASWTIDELQRFEDIIRKTGYDYQHFQGKFPHRSEEEVRGALSTYKAAALERLDALAEEEPLAKKART